MSSHLPLLLAASLGLVSFISEADAAEREPMTQYLVELRLVDTGPHGEARVMAEPSLVTTEGRTARYRVCAEVPAPEGVEPMQPLHYGMTLTLRVFRRGDRVFLDANAESADVKRSDEDSVRITSSGLRLVEAITLGKPIVVPIGRVEAGKPTAQWEVVVKRATPDVIRKIAAEPAPPARPVAAPPAPSRLSVKPLPPLPCPLFAPPVSSPRSLATP